MYTCRTCELTKRRDSGEAPSWDAILRTRHWDVAHADDTSLEGWTILVLRRHVESLADINDEEAAELGPLIKSVSRALAEVLACTKTYVAQFAEDPLHHHVHFHVIPKSAHHPEELLGLHVFACLGVPEGERVPEGRMNEIGSAMARGLNVGHPRQHPSEREDFATTVGSG